MKDANFIGQDLLRSDFHKRFMRFVSICSLAYCTLLAGSKWG
jgi:hypothetical protein